MVKALAAMPADALKLVTMSTEPNSTSTLRAVELAAYVLSAAWALSRRRRSATAREVCLMVGWFVDVNLKLKDYRKSD